MGVRFPLRAPSFFFMNQINNSSGPTIPSKEVSRLRSIFKLAVRWTTTGLFAYLGWLLANIALALLFPFFLLADAFKKPWVIRKITIGFIRFFFLRFLPFIRMYRLEKSADLEKLSQCSKCLIFANHISWLDALILLALVPNVRLLVSLRYGKVPLISRLMRHLGCVFVDKENRESIFEAFDSLHEILEKGGTVAVFPEGSRAPIGEMKPFHEMFFSIAEQAEVSILPVVLHMDVPFLGPKAENFLTSKCATLKIRVLDQIDTYKKTSKKESAFSIRKRMKKVVSSL